MCEVTSASLIFINFGRLNVGPTRIERIRVEEQTRDEEGQQKAPESRRCKGKAQSMKYLHTNKISRGIAKIKRET